MAAELPPERTRTAIGHAINVDPVLVVSPDGQGTRPTILTGNPTITTNATLLVAIKPNRAAWGIAFEQCDAITSVFTPDLPFIAVGLSDVPFSRIEIGSLRKLAGCRIEGLA